MRWSLGADFARGRGAKGAGQRPPAPLPTLVAAARRAAPAPLPALASSLAQMRLAASLMHVGSSSREHTASTACSCFAALARGPCPSCARCEALSLPADPATPDGPAHTIVRWSRHHHRQSPVRNTWHLRRTSALHLSFAALCEHAHVEIRHHCGILHCLKISTPHPIASSFVS